MNYPKTPGYKKSGTSKAAADSMKEKAPSLKDEVMIALGLNGDCTADEVAELLGKSILAIRPRFTELSKPHPLTGAPAKIYDTGITRPNASGRQATVWRVV